MKRFLIKYAVLMVLTVCFSFDSHYVRLMAKDKYTQMKNSKANVDFADVTGEMDFKNHSFGIDRKSVV